jgi:hypothetical protein
MHRPELCCISRNAFVKLNDSRGISARGFLLAFNWRRWGEREKLSNHFCDVKKPNKKKVREKTLWQEKGWAKFVGLWAFDHPSVGGGKACLLLQLAPKSLTWMENVHQFVRQWIIFFLLAGAQPISLWTILKLASSEISSSLSRNRKKSGLETCDRCKWDSTYTEAEKCWPHQAFK